MSSQIIFYDLPSRDPCKAWSLNPWKIRLALNYKGINYRTEWVEYPDLAPLLKSFNVPPNVEGPSYTIPAIKTASGSYIMDSKNIIAHLESEYGPPHYPPLHLDSPVLPLVEDIVKRMMKVIAPITLPLTAVNLLNPPSAEYFERTRKDRFGMPLSELAKGSEEAWEAAKPLFGEMAALLKDTDGPYFMGDITSYPDFHFVTFLHWFKRIDQKIFDRAVAFDPAFRAIYDAYAGYFKRDDH